MAETIKIRWGSTKKAKEYWDQNYHLKDGTVKEMPEAYVRELMKYYPDNIIIIEEEKIIKKSPEKITETKSLEVKKTIEIKKAIEEISLKITFIMTVFENEETIAKLIQSIYPFAHQILIAEGASKILALQKKYHTSKDKTLNEILDYVDIAGKILLIQKPSPWDNKSEAKDALLKFATGDILFEIDPRKKYSPEIIGKVRETFMNDPDTDIISLGDEIDPRIWRIKGSMEYIYHNHPSRDGKPYIPFYFNSDRLDIPETKSVFSWREKIEKGQKKKKVFIHIDSGGFYLGNGGFRGLTFLGNEFTKMGYDTYLFCPNGELKEKLFDWLCLEEKLFKIATLDQVRKEKNKIILSSWLKGLRDSAPFLIEDKGFRYWDHDEMFRPEGEWVQETLLSHTKKIAINNHSFIGYYQKMGFKEIIFMEPWVRSDIMFYDSKLKIKDSIGHQSEDRANITTYLQKNFPKQKVVSCVGDQKEVANKMQQSDYYLYWNGPKDYRRFIEGESWGDPLYEAMACGCVCVARRHDGNSYLDGVIKLVDNLQEAFFCLQIGSLKTDISIKEAARMKSIKHAEANCRWDDVRRESFVRLFS